MDRGIPRKAERYAPAITLFSEIQSENFIMKDSSTTEYKTFQGMQTRCNNTNNEDYKYYGERGMTIEDALTKPMPVKASAASAKKYGGKTAREGAASPKCVVPYSVLQNRLSRGTELHKALLTPARKRQA